MQRPGPSRLPASASRLQAPRVRTGPAPVQPGPAAGPLGKK